LAISLSSLGGVKFPDYAPRSFDLARWFLHVIEVEKVDFLVSSHAPMRANAAAQGRVVGDAEMVRPNETSSRRLVRGQSGQ
jgi:hypothetical protein